MKRLIRHAPLSSEALRGMLAQWRTFVLLSAFTFAAFVAAGMAGMALGSSSHDWPASGAAASLPDGVIREMAGMEIPALASADAEDGLDGRRAASFLFRFLTGINPHQPRSLLSSQLPGLESGRAVMLRAGGAGEHATGPLDMPPLPAGDGPGGGRPMPTDAASEPPEGRETDAAAGDGAGGLSGDAGTGDGLADDGNTGGGPAGGGKGTGEPEDGTGEGRAGQGGTGGGVRSSSDAPAAAKRKTVLIYHSHNRESWLPELGEGAKNAESDKINITLVGRRIAERLEEAGIGTVHSDVDYPSTVKEYRWELSYKYSKETVVEAMAEHDGLAWLLDIHRDSQPRGYTTASIGGKDYAQVYFIIGKGNPDWRRNEAFAAEIHRLLEQRYPGISRGIWGKDASNGNGEYNQSLSPHSLLIEIGGIENTLEECYRTADALAEVLAEIHLSALEAGADAD